MLRSGSNLEISLLLSCPWQSSELPVSPGSLPGPNSIPVTLQGPFPPYIPNIYTLKPKWAFITFYSQASFTDCTSADAFQMFQMSSVPCWKGCAITLWVGGRNLPSPGLDRVPAYCFCASCVSLLPLPILTMSVPSALSAPPSAGLTWPRLLCIWEWILYKIVFFKKER